MPPHNTWTRRSPSPGRARGQKLTAPARGQVSASEWRGPVQAIPRFTDPHPLIFPHSIPLSFPSIPGQTPFPSFHSTGLFCSIPFPLLCYHPPFFGSRDLHYQTALGHQLRWATARLTGQESRNALEGSPGPLIPHREHATGQCHAHSFAALSTAFPDSPMPARHAWSRALPEPTRGTPGWRLPSVMRLAWMRSWNFQWAVRAAGVARVAGRAR